MSSRGRFFRSKLNWLALFLVGAFVFVALAAPWLAPPEPVTEDPAYLEIRVSSRSLPMPPSDEARLGSVPKPPIATPGVPSGQGRAYQWDIYHTMIWGTRSALRFGLVVTAIAATLGTLIGALSAYVAGPIGGALMRLTDAFLVFPMIAAVWLLDRSLFSGLTGPFGMPVELEPWEQLLVDLRIDAIMVALVFFSWMPYARLTNAAVAQLRETDFVTATKSLGAKGWRIVWRHLLPNALSPAIVLAAKDVGGTVILASAFIFIGLRGLLPWAVVLVGGRDYVMGLGGNPFSYWWTFLPIAGSIILFGVAWNLLGDGLNRALNPRQKP